MTSSPSLGWAAIDWVEHYLVHGPGDVQGEPIQLDDEFAAFIVKAYRVDPASGARVVRRAFLSRSKGRSKSGLAAMIECWEALGPCRFDHWAEPGEVSDWGYEYEEGEPVGRRLIYAEILNVATEEGQAGNTYDAVYFMLNPDTCSDALLDDFGKIDVGLSRINLPDHRGFIEPVTAANESKDGGKSTFIVADETHLWVPPQVGKFRLGRMHQTMVRNLLKRKVASGWMLETSTMYAEGEQSVAEGTHTYAKSLRKAGRDDGKLLFDHRQASEEWDPAKRSERLKALREAYGPAAAWMDLEAIADYWDDPQSSEADFRRFWLNQPVSLVAEGALPFTTWMQDLADPDAELRTPLTFGLHVDEDRSAWITAMWPREDGLANVILANDGLPFPAHKIVEECKQRTDKHGGHVTAPSAFEADLAAAGVPVLTMPAGSWSGSCGALADAIKAKTIKHGNQPTLNEAVRAAQWRTAGGQGERAFKDQPGPLSALVRGLWGMSQTVTTVEPFAIWG